MSIAHREAETHYAALSERTVESERKIGEAVAQRGKVDKRSLAHPVQSTVRLGVYDENRLAPMNRERRSDALKQVGYNLRRKSGARGDLS